jgi:hypothetical protein
LSISRWHTCNIVDSGPDRLQFWQFARAGEQVELVAEHRGDPTELLPAKWVRKTLRHLWQRKLNVAWLPANRVFLRVIHLPQCDPKELPGMVEFQLERLSPMPVAQVVWTFQVVPALEAQEQTVLVIIAARDAVEEFLGGLETRGFLADRLELPQVQELIASPPARDGVWVYPTQELDRTLCLVAWWSKGRLQNLNLLSLPPGPSAAEQCVHLLKQVAWAGEMDGWLTGDLEWRLVAEESLARVWVPVLREFCGPDLAVDTPVPRARLAALSASSASPGNLVPPEFAARYRQQFVDRLWMRSLAALGMVYLLVLVAYFGWLEVMKFRKHSVDGQVAALSARYNQALQLKARLQVLQDQHNLKFAALDCWKAVCETLPEDTTLTSLAFQRGKKLQLFGTVPSDQQSRVTEYTEALGKATANGQAVFGQVSTRSIVAQPNRAATWSIDCDVKQVEVE